MMVYVLGHAPWEFGLVPDMDGYISFRELLKAFQEEQGWTHVRQGTINELLLSENRNLFDVKNDGIRVVERHWILNMHSPLKSVPKLLYTAIREKGHAFALDRGLIFRNERCHILSSSRDMVDRLGRRIDRNHVILEITAARALEQGQNFYPFGDLFLIRDLPPEFIAGPPLPKQHLKALEEKPRKKKKKPSEGGFGTFMLRGENDPDRSRNLKGKKKKGWKEEVRKGRRKEQ